MSLESSPKIEILPYGGYVSTSFVYNSVAYQSAANSAYVALSTSAAASNTTPKFKTYDEKIKFLIGKTATASCTK
jgi:hypothetical protein